MPASKSKNVEKALTDTLAFPGVIVGRVKNPGKGAAEPIYSKGLTKLQLLTALVYRESSHPNIEVCVDDSIHVAKQILKRTSNASIFEE